MLICTNLPNLAEVGGSSGLPCRWSKLALATNCQEAQEWRYVSACRCGGVVPVCLPPWDSDFVQVCHFSNLPSLTRKLDEMTRDGQSHEVLYLTLWPALQFVSSNLPHWLVEALWPSHVPRPFLMEREHWTYVRAMREGPDLLVLMPLHQCTTRALLTLTALSVWWRKVCHMWWQELTVTWSSLGKSIVIAASHTIGW